MVGFANLYGHLGVTNPAGSGAQAKSNTESFKVWRESIALMNDCVKAWDSVMGGKGTDNDVQHLEQTVSSQLQLHAQVALIRDQDQAAACGLSLKISPKNLLGALWLQMAEAIDKNYKHRKCPGCGKWLVASGKASTKMHCSDACRKRAERQRKKGKSLKKADGNNG
jgi:hypothetical protein